MESSNLRVSGELYNLAKGKNDHARIPIAEAKRSVSRRYPLGFTLYASLSLESLTLMHGRNDSWQGRSVAHALR